MAGDDQSVLEELSREECLGLVATQAVGRVAVADRGAPPLVVPVNFLLDGERIVCRTDYGTKFRMLVLAELPVSFEVDHVEAGTREGWSVLLQGEVEELGEWDAQQLRLEPWAPGRKPHWVRLQPQSISGRRLRLPELPEAQRRRGYL